MNRKNKDLRVVRDSEDVDKLVRRIMDNTEDEETQMAQLEEQVKAHKKKIRIRILVVVILIVAASVGIYLFIHLQTYTNVRVANTYPEAGSTDSNYKEFSSKIARAASAPSLVDNTRSNGHGDPPLCVCPGIAIRTSC